MADNDKNISVDTFLRTPRSKSTQGVNFGEVVYRPGGVCGPRFQSSWQVVAIISGDSEVEVDKKRCPIPSGHVRLMSPGHWEHYRFAAKTPTHHLWLDFSPSKKHAALLKMLSSLEPMIPLSPTLEALLRAGLDVDVSISRGVLALEAIAVAALSLLCAEAQSGRERLGPMHPSVVRACHFIEKNLSRQMELSSISHAAGLSLNHFSRLFDRQLGYTPIEYVWHLRIQKAASMLRSTGLSVGEISTQTGFQNPFHFSRRFKAAFGSSPRAYRTHTWNKSPSN